MNEYCFEISSSMLIILVLVCSFLILALYVISYRTAPNISDVTAYKSWTAPVECSCGKTATLVCNVYTPPKCMPDDSEDVWIRDINGWHCDEGGHFQKRLIKKE